MTLPKHCGNGSPDIGRVVPEGAPPRLFAVNQSSGSGDVLLNAIASAVIGGTSLFGGRGTVFGSLLGALIVGVFRSGLSLAGVDDQYRVLAIGVLVITAVAIDQWIRKVRA